MSKQKYGRYKSFRAWMLETLAVHLLLLISLAWLMGYYDALGYMVTAHLADLFGITAV